MEAVPKWGDGGGGGYFLIHVYAIKVRAAPKGRVFAPF